MVVAVMVGADEGRDERRAARHVGIQPSPPRTILGALALVSRRELAEPPTDLRKRLADVSADESQPVTERDFAANGTVELHEVLGATPVRDPPRTADVLEVQ